MKAYLKFRERETSHTIIIPDRMDPKGGYPKMKPCSDVDEKTRSKFIGRVNKNTAVSTLRSSLSVGRAVYTRQYAYMNMHNHT